MGMFGSKKIFDAVEKVEGEHTFSIKGKTVMCPQCGSNKFESRYVMLNTAWMTFFDLDWANRQAAILTCSNCTHIQWFLRQPDIVS